MDGDRDVIELFNIAHGRAGHDVLLIRKLRAAGLDDRAIAAVLEAMESTCPACWDAEAGCRCADDE